ncbi:uncharacterized protein LOC135336265 [Halichondria panicea]|uniref:uncharacterized protein LOC135336265 n=1 Tax=Halichondria panicea TaxID=6063 RepID=UPI00312BAC8E
MRRCPKVCMQSIAIKFVCTLGYTVMKRTCSKEKSEKLRAHTFPLWIKLLYGFFRSAAMCLDSTTTPSLKLVQATICPRRATSWLSPISIGPGTEGPGRESLTGFGEWRFVQALLQPHLCRLPSPHRSHIHHLKVKDCCYSPPYLDLALLFKKK